MVWLRRITLFLLVNFSVMLVVGLILWLIGAQDWLSAQGLNIPSLLLSCLLWGMGGALFSLLISKQIARWTMGVQLINRNHPTSTQADLLRLVDHLAQKAGLQEPLEVGIYASPELNAFATGPSQRHALVAVSSGLLRSMSQQELEGVLGHEISHIKNGDMITMTLLQGVMNAFVLFLSRVIAYAVVMGSRRSGEEDSRQGSYGAFSLVSLLLQTLFMILAGLVIAAYSRWREYRADAGGAQLAGKQAMIEALRALERGSKIVDPAHDAASIAALKISGTPWKLGELFASHPPLESRISRLETL